MKKYLQELGFVLLAIITFILMSGLSGCVMVVVWEAQNVHTVVDESDLEQRFPLPLPPDPHDHPDFSADMDSGIYVDDPPVRL